MKCEPIPEFIDDDEDEDRTCPECHGSGTDRYDDHISPCPKCDGEGYLWWL